MRIGNRFIFFLFFLGSVCISNVKAQHKSHDAKNEAKSLFTSILNQSLTDPELKDYQMQSMVLEIGSGFIDTVAHRHDCELFGYVLEGKIKIGLEKNVPVTYNAGQMFYEQRNVLHSVLENLDPANPAKILLIFIIKNGRKGYTREH